MIERDFFIGHGITAAMLFFGSRNVHGIGVVLMMANYICALVRIYREP